MKWIFFILLALSYVAHAEKISVIVNLSGQYAVQPAELAKHPPAVRGKVLAKSMETFTRNASDSVTRFLRTNQLNEPLDVKFLWLTNSLSLTADTKVVQRLVGLEGVENIVPDEPKETNLEIETGSEALAPKKLGIGSGVEKIRAPELWAQQIDGRGVVVALIDSGINLTHPDLQGNLWRNAGETGIDSQGNDRASNGIDDDENGYIDDVSGWNFEENSDRILDKSGHGSKAAGLIVGNGTNGLKTGVAPGAKLMVLRTCCRLGTRIFESKAWEAMQYAVRNGARVISMSLSVKHSADPSYAKWRRAGEVLLAAGVVHVNSAGNQRSEATPYNLGAPATNPPAWFHPRQTVGRSPSSMLTIGAVDFNDEWRPYSSTGPATWEHVDEYRDFLYDRGRLNGLKKPDLCAPSEVPTTAARNSGYIKSFLGTSSSTPQAAGVVALLLQAKPKITVAQVTEALQMSAVPVGGGFTNTCGAGRIDALAAVKYAQTRFK